MKQYKILGQMKMEKLEEELNRLADDGWRVSMSYPYWFKEQLKLFILMVKEKELPKACAVACALARDQYHRGRHP